MLKRVRKILKDIQSSYKLRGLNGFLRHATFHILEKCRLNKQLSKNRYIENPEMDSDMVESMFIRWKQNGFLLEPTQRKMYEVIAKLIKKLDVCDVGCGSGLGSLILAQEAKSVVGIEKIQKCTEFAQKCFPVKNIKYVNEDITNCSYRENSFDAVIAIEIIEHISNYHSALQEIKWILKNNGKLYISSPNRNNENIGKNKPKNIHHIREWTIKEFYEVLSLYFKDIRFFDSTLVYQQKLDSKTTPIIAICRKNQSTPRIIPVVKSNRFKKQLDTI